MNTLLTFLVFFAGNFVMIWIIFTVLEKLLQPKMARLNRTILFWAMVMGTSVASFLLSS
ncbi:hypothetical protein ACFQPF_06735 [Fictibacillus iocasae]|uniref:Uncharacterized protein n=1 Tax=Fictibacillus iocasae TaxID=2715437 RepID=A0ABW2NL17_9BACL